MDNLLRDRKSDFSDIFLTGNASPQDYFKYGKSTKKFPFYTSKYVVADLADLWSVLFKVPINQLNQQNYFDISTAAVLSGHFFSSE